MIKENYEEYIVEFRVTIVDPTYSKLLRDPDAAQYDDITRELTDKVRDKCEFTDSQQILTVLRAVCFTCFTQQTAELSFILILPSKTKTFSHSSVISLCNVSYNKTD